MRTNIHRIAALGLALCASGLATAAEPAGYDPRWPLTTAPMPVMSYESLASGSPIHSGGATPADSALALDVAAALASNPELDGATITVSANNGNVTLSGSAPSTEQAAHAETTARGVAGVGSVSGTLSAQGG
jgi:hypothetical protein